MFAPATAPSSARFLLVALSLSAPGCSFVFVDGPPRHAPTYVSAPREKVCTESRLAPALDVTASALEALRASVALASSPETYRRAGLDRAWEVGLGIAFAALFASSAGYGFVVTHECARYYRNLGIVSSVLVAGGG